MLHPNSNCPKEFQLFGNRIVVKKVKDLKDENGVAVNGLADLDGLCVYIDASLRSTQRWTTFCHEVVHMVNGLLGYDELYANEIYTEQVAQAVYQIIKTAKN